MFRLLNRFITCQQCQAHDRSGRCWGQKRDHALDPSMLRKSPPTGISSHYKMLCIFFLFMSERHAQLAMHCVGLDDHHLHLHHLHLHHLPPSRHLWVFVHLHLPTASAWTLVRAHSDHWTAKMWNQSGTMLRHWMDGYTCAALTRRDSRRCRNKAASRVSHPWEPGTFHFMQVNFIFIQKHFMTRDVKVLLTHQSYLGLHWDKFMTSWAS